jgi:hypothetical protein
LEGKNKERTLINSRLKTNNLQYFKKTHTILIISRKNKHIPLIRLQSRLYTHYPNTYTHNHTHKCPQEHEKNQLLRDKKWRNWRREQDDLRQKNKPPWREAKPSSSIVTQFYDEKGLPFQAEDGDNSDEVWENTVEAYLKTRLDR